jgi:hypothetical protein
MRWVELVVWFLARFWMSGVKWSAYGAYIIVEIWWERENLKVGGTDGNKGWEEREKGAFGREDLMI